MSQKQNEHTKEYAKQHTPNILGEKLNDHNLFDNAMVKAAKAAIPQKDQERYKKMGEEMYGSMDFETCEVLNNMPMPMAEAVNHLSTQLDSGLLPSDMTENEKELLKDAYGEKWYEKWDFVKKDLVDIFSTKT